MMLTIVLSFLILAKALPHLDTPNGKWFWRRIVSILLLCTLILIYESISHAAEYLFNGLVFLNFQITCLHLLVVFTGLSLIINSKTPYYNKNVSVSISTTDNKTTSLIFMISALTGSLLLSTANTSLTLLLGLELQSFSVYILAASHKNNHYEPSESAGLKYFLLGAQSSALIYMGLALLYVASGSLNLNTTFLVSFSSNMNTYLAITGYTGFTLMFIGFIWKIAAAPVHAWSVDVYDAVPSKTAAFLSLVPKIALISILIRIVNNLLGAGNFPTISDDVYTNYISIVICSVIILSLLIGSISGLYQPRLKRLLAYSSILNMGFILMSIYLTNCTEDLYSTFSTVTYLIQYILVTIATWLCLIIIPGLSAARVEITTISQLQGISNITSTSINNEYQIFSSTLAITLTILFLSVAGIPPMVGFFAKYEVILLAVETQHMLLAIVAIVASLISTVYYLRVVRNIWFISHLQVIAVTQKQNNNTLSVTDVNNLSTNNLSTNNLSTNNLFTNNYTSIMSIIMIVVVGYSFMYTPLYTLISISM